MVESKRLEYVMVTENGVECMRGLHSISSDRLASLTNTDVWFGTQLWEREGKHSTPQRPENKAMSINREGVSLDFTRSCKAELRDLILIVDTALNNFNNILSGEMQAFLFLHVYFLSVHARHSSSFCFVQIFARWCVHVRLCVEVSSYLCIYSVMLRAAHMCESWPQEEQNQQQGSGEERRGGGMRAKGDRCSAGCE